MSFASHPANPGTQMPRHSPDVKGDEGFGNSQPQESQPTAAAMLLVEAELRQRAQHSVQRIRTCDASRCNVWVCTDLAVLTLDGPELYPEDVVQGSKAFRRLSPDFFLWLEGRFTAFRRKTNLTGQLSEDAKALAERFQSIRTMAEALYTPAQFDAARKRLALFPMESPNKATVAAPPQSWFSFPAQSALRFRRPVTHHALAEVDFIHDEAIRLGWTEAELYQNRGIYSFPHGQDYGVVCFIHHDQRLGTVTSSAIEVICRGGHSLHCYRRVSP